MATTSPLHGQSVNFEMDGITKGLLSMDTQSAAALTCIQVLMQRSVCIFKGRAFNGESYSQSIASGAQLCLEWYIFAATYIFINTYLHLSPCILPT